MKFKYNGYYTYDIDYDEEYDYLYLTILDSPQISEDGNDYFEIFKRITQIDFSHFLKDKQEILETIDHYHCYVFSIQDDLEKIYEIIESR